MKNLRNSVLSMLLVSFGAIANDELKIGVSVGFDSVDYTLTQTYLDAEFGSAQANFAVERNEAVPTEGNMKYLSPTLTLDARYGRHGVSLKRANGDFAGFREATLMPNQGYPYTNYSRENDDPRRVETSLTYSFKINNNWSVALGTYDGEVEMSYVDRGIDTVCVESYDPVDWINFVTDWTSCANANNPVFDWAIRHTGEESVESNGKYIAAVYQDKITNNLFWFGKLGYQKTDLDTAGTAKFLEVQQFSSACAASVPTSGPYGDLTGFWCGSPDLFGNPENPADGFEWDVEYVKGSSGDATILGLGLVYAFNPNNTVTLSYEVKSFSFDAGTMDLTYTAIPPAQRSGVVNASENIGLSDEADVLSLTFRHQF